MVVGNHSLKWFETYGNNVENEKMYIGEKMFLPHIPRNGNKC